MSTPSSIKDPGSIVRATFDNPTQSVRMLPVGGSLVPDKYDNLALTYVPSGNGAGQVQTVAYYLSATLICTLTLGYDSSNRVITVVRA